MLRRAFGVAMFRLLDYKSQVPTKIEVVRFTQALTPTIQSMELIANCGFFSKESAKSIGECEHRVEQLRRIVLTRMIHGDHFRVQLTRNGFSRALEVITEWEPDFNPLDCSEVAGLVAFECLARIGDAVTGDKFMKLQNKIARQEAILKNLKRPSAEAK